MKQTGYDFWNHVLKRPQYVAAPMVDMSELSFRMLCRQYGAQLCFSPMLHSQQYLQDVLYRSDTFSTCLEDNPLIVQFCSNDPDDFVNAGHLVSSQCSAIDLNLGCPQAIARKGRYGAFLQDDWDLIHHMVQKASAQLSVPVTCKMRILPGDLRNSVQYAKMLEDSGCSVLTVHGRTRDQKGHATGLASWEVIREIKANVNIPVIANGNILSFRDVQECLAYTGVDAVMSAEALLHNPALFSGRNPPVWLMVQEYLQYAEKYNTPIRCVRCHLFKILYLCIHQDDKIQEALADGKTYADFYAVCDLLRDLPTRNAGISQSQETIENSSFSMDNNLFELLDDGYLETEPVVDIPILIEESKSHFVPYDDNIVNLRDMTTPHSSVDSNLIELLNGDCIKPNPVLDTPIPVEESKSHCVPYDNIVVNHQNITTPHSVDSNPVEVSSSESKNEKSDIDLVLLQKLKFQSIPAFDCKMTDSVATAGEKSLQVHSRPAMSDKKHLPVWLCHSRPRVINDEIVSRGCYSKYFESSIQTKEENLAMSKKKLRKLRRHEKVVAAKKEKRKTQKMRRKQKLTELRQVTNEEKEEEELPGDQPKMTKKEKKSRIRERLLQAQGTAPKVCINLGFTSTMDKKELSRLSSQLRRLYGSNRQSMTPFHLYFCNFDASHDLYKICLEKNDGFSSYVVDKTEKSPEEMFKPEDIIYLSPDSENVLTSLDPHKVYVIGGIVDGTVKKGLSLNHAKQLDIQTARLPIVEYLVKCSPNIGTTVLTVNQVFDILLKYYETEDWVQALGSNVPLRKGFCIPYLAERVSENHIEGNS